MLNKSKEEREKLRAERLGEIGYNDQGCKMEIIEYVNTKDITVKFEDGGIREHIQYNAFKRGEIRSPFFPSLYGVGMVGGERTKINGVMIREYRFWKGMLSRCYDKNRPGHFRYSNCTVSDEWKLFPNFIQWCHEQENWSKVEKEFKIYHLDKDIIKKGNYIYSADFCCFVPYYVNYLFTKGKANRGEYPIGVSAKNNRFKATCSKVILGLGSIEYLADTPEEAFLWYKNEKENVIKQVAERELKLGTITKKCYESMINYEVEITD